MYALWRFFHQGSYGEGTCEGEGGRSWLEGALMAENHGLVYLNASSVYDRHNDDYSRYLFIA
jgi:hypothetical protein